MDNRVLLRASMHFHTYTAVRYMHRINIVCGVVYHTSHTVVVPKIKLVALLYEIQSIPSDIYLLVLKCDTMLCS